MLVAGAAAFGAAAPAAAHDELQGSSPSSEERLALAPETVTLTFSADVLAVGAAVIVVDDSGRDWVSGEPLVDQATVTAMLDPGMPVAGYEIRWRVVSSDGHPISGIIPFTVGDAAPLARTATPDASTSPVDAGTGTESQSTQENEGALRVVLIGAGGAVIAIAVFALIHFLRRRANRGGTGASDE
ncbi:copper resistance protein CopC [Microbacterium sp. Root61]|nr:copper resistance protein CopC [Microbacterium sp. Root61]